MLREYRIKKLEQYIAAQQAVKDEMVRLFKDVESVPLFYIDLAISTEKNIAISKKKLEQLEKPQNRADSGA